MPVDPHSKPDGERLVAVPRRGTAAHPANDPTVARRNASRILRTALLGTLALGAGVWYFADQFGVDKQELVGYLAISALLMLILAAAGALAARLLRLLRR